jgi:acetylornithine deacetylase/succinyl-diaminopimelate desuccinylase
MKAIYEKLLRISSKEEVTKLLVGLVRIPSHEKEIGGEERVADYLLEFFSKEGVPAEKQYVQPNRPNIIAKLEYSKNSNSIMLSGHTDINPPEGMTIPPFEGIVKDGKVFGRGALDMKGGIAAMAYALILLNRFDLKLNGSALFAGVIGEAIGGSEGTKYLINHLPIRVSMGIVGEPTGLNIITAHKGMEWFEIIIHGKAAFGATPELGINAIEKGIDFINVLRKELYPKLRQRSHPLVGSPTLNIGIIEGYGGHKRPNVVPDFCRILMDRRLIPGENGEQAYRELIDIVNKLSGMDSSFVAEVRRLPEMMGRSPMEIPTNHPIVESIKKSYITVMGREPKIMGGSGFTDAAYFVNDAKIPTAVFGPGLYKGPESYTEESIEIDEVLTASIIYALTIYSACEKNTL